MEVKISNALAKCNVMSFKLRQGDIVQWKGFKYPANESRFPKYAHEVHTLSLRIKMGFWRELFFQHLNSGASLIIEMPEEVEWVYPDWVWWTPSPENEKYYRFLKAGHEEFVKRHVRLDHCFVKAIHPNEDMVDIEIQALSADFIGTHV